MKILGKTNENYLAWVLLALPHKKGKIKQHCEDMKTYSLDSRDSVDEIVLMDILIMLVIVTSMASQLDI